MRPLSFEIARFVAWLHERTLPQEVTEKARV